MVKSLTVENLDYSKLKILGILSSLPMHKLSWHLNQLYEWDMSYLGDICFDQEVYFIVKVEDVLDEKWVDFSFPLHAFKEEGSWYEVNLIQNKGANGYFLPEMKQFDYLLVFHGEFDYLPENLIENIRRLSQVQLAVEIQINKIKDRHILVSYK